MMVRLYDYDLPATKEKREARRYDNSNTQYANLGVWAAADAGLYDDLVTSLGAAEILARGPKSVGVLRANGLRELWAPESECFEDVLAHLRGRDLTGKRIVVQEHGQSLSTVAHALRRQGAHVRVVTVYRVEGSSDPAPMRLSCGSKVAPTASRPRSMRSLDSLR